MQKVCQVHYRRDPPLCSSLLHCITVGNCAGVVYDQVLAEAVAQVQDDLR